MREYKFKNPLFGVLLYLVRSITMMGTEGPFLPAVPSGSPILQGQFI